MPVKPLTEETSITAVPLPAPPPMPTGTMVLFGTIVKSLSGFSTTVLSTIADGL